MIYGEDVTHIITEEGIANLLLCATPEEREQAIRGVAGSTPIGLARDKRMVEKPARPEGYSAAGPRHQGKRRNARHAVGKDLRGHHRTVRRALCAAGSAQDEVKSSS